MCECLNLLFLCNQTIIVLIKTKKSLFYYTPLNRYFATHFASINFFIYRLEISPVFCVIVHFVDSHFRYGTCELLLGYFVDLPNN